MEIELAIEHFLHSRRAKNVAATTLTTYEFVLYKFARQMPEIRRAEDINHLTVRMWMSRLQQAGTKDITVLHHYRHFKAFVKFLLAEGILTDDFYQSKRVEPPKVAKRRLVTLSDEDFRRMVAACDTNSDMGRRDAAILMFLYDTGVRVSELAALKVADLDLKARQAKVWGKGSQERIVFFSTHTALALSRYLSRRRARPGDDESFVFLGYKRNHQGQFHPNGVLQVLRRVARKAGVTARVNPHTFRHTFATNYLRLGGDPHSLQRILGHADISTTIKNYAHMVTEDLQRKHEQFSPLAAAMGPRRRG